jgi:hypothetical protein
LAWRLSDSIATSQRRDTANVIAHASVIGWTIACSGQVPVRTLIDIAAGHVVCSRRDMPSHIRLLVILCVALAAAASLHAAERTGKKAFEQAWVGRSVVVKRPLYSLVFDERSRLVPVMKHKDRVSGLTVVTPTGTYYYQFDSRRDSEEDIVDQDPDRIVSKMRDQYYRSKHLDNGAVQEIEPLMLVRYSSGVALIVKKVQIERDRVRLYFHKEGEADLATTLTVKFPTPLSKELTESALIDDAISRFVTRD